MRRVKDIECEKCGHEFSASEHTQCPKCIKSEEKNKNFLKKRSLDEKFKEESYGEEHRIREKERKAKLKNDQSKICLLYTSDAADE